MTIQQVTAVCDGWDARVVTDAGEALTLHYATKPEGVTVLEDAARYVTWVAETKAAEAAKIAAEEAEAAAKEAKLAQADTAIATAAVAVAQAQADVAAAQASAATAIATAADHLSMIDAWKHLEQKQRDLVLEAWPEFEALLKEAAK
jgi:hypothetical protein